MLASRELLEAAREVAYAHERYMEADPADDAEFDSAWSDLGKALWHLNAAQKALDTTRADVWPKR